MVLPVGFFANGQPQVISGYVSAYKDEGLPTEEPLDSVTVNGIATTLGSIDGNGNVPFTTVAAVPVPTNGEFMSINIQIIWPSTNTIPLGILEGYDVVNRLQTNQSICATASRYIGASCWNIHLESEYWSDSYEYRADSPTPTNVTTVTEHTWKYHDGQCQSTVDPSSVTFYHPPGTARP